MVENTRKTNGFGAFRGLQRGPFLGPIRDPSKLGSEREFNQNLEGIKGNGESHFRIWADLAQNRGCVFFSQPGGRLTWLVFFAARPGQGTWLVFFAAPAGQGTWLVFFGAK